MILAVTGGKGGVGKTTIAYNLAAALDAVVVDADLGMADLPSAAGSTLHDVLGGRMPVQQAIQRTVRDGPVEYVPCGRTLAGARASDLTKLGDALRTLDQAHGHVIVDCPAGRRADAGVPLAVADACLLVVSPRAFALRDAIRTRELARELDAGLSGCVLNRVTKADRSAESTATSRVADVLGAPTRIVPEDDTLCRSVTAERPIVHTAPDSAAGRAIHEVADHVRQALAHHARASTKLVAK